MYYTNSLSDRLKLSKLNIDVYMYTWYNTHDTM